MGKIILTTKIHAPIERCFDLSTSIDLHKISASQTNEKAIDGITEGLIQLNQTVTWKAKHFGFWHKMKVKITEYEKPNYFVDEMVKGTFKFMHHKHEFAQHQKLTIMKDTFTFSSPFGFIGRLVDKLFLDQYMTDFIKKRNLEIKKFAESEKWKEIL